MLCIITLKFWLPIRPPICSEGGRPTKPRKPGYRSSCGRSCCAICCAVTGRLARGTSCTMIRPLFAPPPPQAPLVAGEQRVERAVHQTREALLAVDDAQEAAAEHRRQRDRHDARDQNRRRNRDGELAEQPSENPAHEEDRNEDGGERRRH